MNLIYLLIYLLQDQLSLNRCWGYEKSCPEENRMSMPECPGHHKGWLVTHVHYF